MDRSYHMVGLVQHRAPVEMLCCRMISMARMTASRREAVTMDVHVGIHLVRSTCSTVADSASSSQKPCSFA